MRILPAVFALAAVLPAVADPSAWEPGKTWATMAGVLEWQDKNLSPFPKKDRQDRALESALKADGVPGDHIAFLEDREATLEAIREKLRAACEAAPEGSTLIFYFAGHGIQNGGEIYFANYDVDTSKPKETGLAMADIAGIVTKHFKGARLLFFADCCYSGGLAKVVHGFDRDAGRSAACLTSATACNVSTGEWTFTASLVAAFSGNALVDTNGDGRLSIRETDAFVAGEMRFREAQLTRGAYTPKFDGDFVLRAADPATKPKEIPGPWRMRDYCEVEWNKEWFRAQVIDGRDGGWRIHYIGYKDTDDEWVEAKRMRPPQGIRASGGDKVMVEWQKKWWPATVTKVEGDFAFVHYDGWGDEWDEWVTARRVKKK